MAAQPCPCPGASVKPIRTASGAAGAQTEQLKTVLHERESRPADQHARERGLRAAGHVVYSAAARAYRVVVMLDRAK